MISLAGRSQEIERRIIIQGNRFYYTTVDQEFQIATLHTGSVDENLSAARHFAMPAGRSLAEPVNPLAWDLQDSMVYVVNFLVHAQNNKHEALKRFPLRSLQEWDSTITVRDMLIKSVHLPSFAVNEPYRFMVTRSNVLNNFFFDGIALNDSVYVMVIHNNGDLYIWEFNGNEWKHSKMQHIAVTGHFNLFAFDQQLYLLLNSGQIYKVSVEGASLLPSKTSPASLSGGVVIVNRDHNTIQFIKNGPWDQNISLNELIKKKAVKIF
jgi:hypothetical protein